MPHVCPRHHPHEINPVRLEAPMYMANGPMYVIYYPCPCGLEPCVQPVLVNSHHVRSLQAAQHGGIIHIPPPVANHVIPNVLDHHVLPPHLQNRRIANEFAADFVVDQEPQHLEYPMYPEARPRENRRRNRSRRSRKIEGSILDSDNECEVDR